MGGPTYKIEIFICEAFVDALCMVARQTGAGHIGGYDHCAAVSEVTGHCCLLTDARSFAGEVEPISREAECKVEFNGPKSAIRQVLDAVRQVSPYQEPMLNVIVLANHRSLLNAA